MARAKKPSIVQATPGEPTPEVVVVPARFSIDLSHIAEGLRPLAFPISDLVPDPKNARLHDEANLATIKASLLRFGQDQPLVVKRDGMVVIKGNGRLEAAKRLGWSHMAIVIVEEDSAESMARAIADNRSSELGSWDVGVLADLMASIKDEKPEALEATGFTEEALAALVGIPLPAEPVINPRADPVAPDEFPSFTEDIPTDYKCPRCNYAWSGGQVRGSET